MSEARPITDAARNGSEYQMRRSVRTCQRMRTDSAHDGGASSVSTTACFGAAGPAFEVATAGLLQLEAEDHEHERRDDEDEERARASRTPRR